MNLNHRRFQGDYSHHLHGLPGISLTTHISYNLPSNLKQNLSFYVSFQGSLILDFFYFFFKCEQWMRRKNDRIVWKSGKGMRGQGEREQEERKGEVGERIGKKRWKSRICVLPLCLVLSSSSPFIYPLDQPRSKVEVLSLGLLVFKNLTMAYSNIWCYMHTNVNSSIGLWHSQPYIQNQSHHVFTY